MSSNKKRLCIGLYARGGTNTYHWAFLVCPKTLPEPAIRYHVVNEFSNSSDSNIGTWIFEGRHLEKLQTQLLLVRVIVAKIVKSIEELERSLRRVQIVQDDRSWTCRTWIRNAFEQLFRDCVLGTGVYDWVVIERASLQYVDRKTREGRFQIAHQPSVVPTYDLIEGIELES